MKTIQHKFVEFIPDVIGEGILYVSIDYCIAIHKCICGCGNEVVTPLSPTDWEITFDGKTISLSPSIGNWNFECKSHYWITKSKIILARRWSFKQIDEGRKEDLAQKKKYFGKRKDKKSLHRRKCPLPKI